MQHCKSYKYIYMSFLNLGHLTANFYDFTGKDVKIGLILFIREIVVVLLSYKTLILRSLSCFILTLFLFYCICYYRFSRQ